MKASEDACGTSLLKRGSSFFLHGVLSHRLGGTLLLCLPFLCIAFLTRMVLLAKSHEFVEWNVSGILGVFTWGGFYDFVAASYFAIPMGLYWSVLPERVFASRLHRRLTSWFFFVVFYGLLFAATVEYLFWDEFGARFNFIAVDYLIYTTEVVGNIRESYPLPLILVSLLVLNIALFLAFYRTGWLKIWLESQTPGKSRIAWGMGILVVPLIFTLTMDNWTGPSFGNNYNQELAKNGLYSLFAAFRNNEIDYDEFYKTEDDQEAFQQMRKLLITENSSFLSADPLNLTRFVSNQGEEKHFNIIQITVESLSAKFMSAFGNKENLTPNLDALANEGILFTHFYATGTRTDRGMEALTLSVPPTPGRSIIKRPNNEHLFSLGEVFRDHGYETAFMYGGYGYFDNMNHFFGNNGYKLIDRAAAPKDAITFTNAWGACDEDLYTWVLDEADRSHAQGKPFFHFVMTTSNHRPYTYPDGRVDIPSHTGRKGAVKYTDYAIGELIRKAKEKPWFSNTVFVIVADHCANSAGKTGLPINQYRIPMIIYNPELIPPQKVNATCSQIDYPPTLLGMLHWSYESKFYGKDIFRMNAEDERAFISNYQELGYMKDEELTILKPIRKEAAYHYDLRTGDLVPKRQDIGLTRQAIAYYQTASYTFHHRLGAAFR